MLEKKKCSPVGRMHLKKIFSTFTKSDCLCGIVVNVIAFDILESYFEPQWY